MTNESKIAWTNDQAREALAQYEPLVRGMARRLGPLASAGRGLDVDDLQAEGRVAVLEALSTFEQYGVAEATWVRVRVRQRMVDAIRRLDTRSRSELRLLSRDGSDELDEDERDRCRSLRARRLDSLDASPAGRETTLGACLSDPDDAPVDEVVHASRQHDRLRALIVDLPPNARVTLELRLFEGASLAEVGERLGVTPARVCQIQTAAVKHLSAVFASAA